MSNTCKYLDDFLKGKNLNKIFSLNLSGRDLCNIPAKVFLCKNLKKLNLSHNRLRTLPKEIGDLKNLKVLNVSHNHLTSIPAPICQLPKLKTLNVGYNCIKTLPKQLASSSITTLIADNNKIESVDTALIGRIERLVLSNNKIKNFYPLLPLLNLRYFWLNNNPCIDEGYLIGESAMFPAIVKSYPKIKIKDELVSPRNNDHTLTSMDKTLKNKIFISYSHADEKWLNILKTHLVSLQKHVGGIEYWDDRRLRTGDKWKEEIEHALNSASAAIFIVSQDFLASDFITNEEVPPLIEKAKTKGTAIFPVIARRCLFTFSSLSEYQAVNPPEKPLMACSDAEVDEYLYKLMVDIISKLGLDKRKG